MIDFNYTAPELLPFRIQEVLDAPNEPHRIGGVVYVPEGGGECEVETTENWLPAERYHRCKNCGAFFAVMNASGDIPPCVCPNCGKAVKR